ncbi:unnamed protein product [Lactuca saligna]|uniref:Uncharacterized protein n=1 Tax=Lactuca saligna TaxID=75948 RepID=A0AA35YKR9_LACSI|nr:unnamed protein product [Lactuca saligna]
MKPLSNISLSSIGFSLHRRPYYLNATICFSLAARSYNEFHLPRTNPQADSLTAIFAALNDKLFQLPALEESPQHKQSPSILEKAHRQLCLQQTDQTSNLEKVQSCKFVPLVYQLASRQGGPRVDEVPLIWVNRTGVKTNITENFTRQSKFTYGIVMEEITARDESSYIS